MRKNLNSFHVEGYLYDCSKLEKRVSGESSKNPGTVYLSGEIDVAVDEAGLNVIPIHFSYVTAFYSSGKENRNFPILERMATDSQTKIAGVDAERTWLKVGKDAALKVKVDGNLSVNDFYSRDNERVTAQRCEGSFVSITPVLEDEISRNTFRVDTVINRVTHVDADPDKNIEKDFTSVNGAIFNFRNDLMPVTFVLHNKDGMQHFENLEASPSNPVYTCVWGHIYSQTIKVEKIEESAFGEASVQTFERKNREWVINGTSKVPFDFGDEKVMTAEELTQASQNREIMWAELKKRNDEYQASKNVPKTMNNAAAAAASVVAGGFDF